MLLTGLATVVAGCSSGGDGKPASEKPAYAETAWRNADLRPLSQVVDGTHGIGVYYALDGARPVISGIDLKTGRTRWKHGVSVAGQGFLRPEVMQGRVAFIEGDTNAPAGTLTIVDAATGKVLQRSKERIASSTGPSGCDENDFCLYVGSGEDTRYVRMSPSSPELVDYKDDGIGYDNDAETFAVQENGKQVWKRPASEVLRGQNLSRGFSYSPFSVGGVYPFTSTVNGTGRKGSVRPDQVALTGVARKDGRTWSLRGLTTCSTRIPANGFGIDRDSTVDTACRFTSGRVAPASSGGTTDATYELVGLDFATGKVRWQIPMGRTTSDPSGPLTVDGRTAFVKVAGKPTLVDIETGRQKPAPKGYVVWRLLDVQNKVGPATMPLVNGYAPEADGAAATRIPWPLPKELGAQTPRIHAVVTKDAVVGYRARR